MYKRILFVICFFLILMLTGCFSKKAITTDEFKSIVEKHGYLIMDAKSQFEEYSYIREATIANKDREYQIEFYVISDETNAIGVFNNNKSDFESYIEGATSQSSTELGNYSSYTLNSSGYYMHICRVENTVLYLKVPKRFKDSVNKVIDELGY